MNTSLHSQSSDSPENPAQKAASSMESLLSRFSSDADRSVLFQLLVDAVQFRVCLVDREGRIVHLNQACCDLYGLEREAMIGADFLQAVPAERRKYMRHLHTEAMRGNDMQPFELELRTAEGEAIWAQISSSRLNFAGEQYRVLSLVDVTERKRLEESLQRLATTDSLTGLANRRQFLERAGNEARRGERRGAPPAVLMIDLDHFKKINDTYGHATGDRVLVEFARSCQHNLREGDLLGRLGGEEFAAVLPDADEDAAAALAERLRKHLCALPVPAPGGEILFSASSGVARVLPGETSIEPALHRADIALYQAKRAGRNRVVVYDKDHAEHSDACGTDFATRQRQAKAG